MKKRNPFGVLTRIASIRERQARRRLAEHAADAARLRAKLAELKAAYANHGAGETTILTRDQALALHLQGVRSYESIREAIAEYEAAEFRVETSREAWRRAADEQDAIEEVDERRKKATATEARRAADRALDDLMHTLKRGRAS